MLYLTVALHPSPVHTTGQGARGRNGYFAPAGAQLSIWRNFNDAQAVRVEIFSKRPGRTPPIILTLSAEDAKALGDALLAMAKAIEEHKES